MKKKALLHRSHSMRRSIDIYQIKEIEEEMFDEFNKK